MFRLEMTSERWSRLLPVLLACPFLLAYAAAQPAGEPSEAGLTPKQLYQSLHLGEAFLPLVSPGEVTILVESLFIRGDCNNDGIVDLADPIYNLSYQFLIGLSVCLDAHDTNDDGGVDVGDPIYNLNYQFLDGPPPPGPFLDCDLDPTEDLLGCGSYKGCP